MNEKVISNTFKVKSQVLENRRPSGDRWAGLNAVEKSFFEKRPEDLDLYNYFTDSQKARFNSCKDGEDRESYFQDTKNDKIVILELMTDEMTGMLRREQMYFIINKRLKDLTLAEIEKLPLSVSAIDFANLGYFNTKSHDAGDKALIVAATVIRKVLESVNSDGFRAGGDEFAFVIDGDKDQADIIARKISELVGKVDTGNPDIMHGYKFELPLNVDIGNATISEGVEAFKKYCGNNDMDPDMACEEGYMRDLITEFAYKIADRRGMYVKHCNFLRSFVKMYHNTKQSPKQYQRVAEFMSMKKKIKLEFVEQVAMMNEQDQENAIRNYGMEMLKAHDGIEEEKFHFKNQIIKDIVDKDLQSLNY